MTNIQFQKALFNKICLLNTMADSIAAYGMQCGIADLFDQIDMACGAIPEGSFERIIDQSAPDQFLSLYLKTAENRFAMAVTVVGNLHENCVTAIKKFLNDTGALNQIDGITTAEEAFALYDAYILDGLKPEGTKTFVTRSHDTVSWTQNDDAKRQGWERFGSNIATWYELLPYFANGLLGNTGFTFSITDDTYTISTTC